MILKARKWKGQHWTRPEAKTMFLFNHFALFQIWIWIRLQFLRASVFLCWVISVNHVVGVRWGISEYDLEPPTCAVKDKTYAWKVWNSAEANCTLLKTEDVSRGRKHEPAFHSYCARPSFVRDKIIKKWHLLERWIKCHRFSLYVLCFGSMSSVLVFYHQIPMCFCYAF